MAVPRSPRIRPPNTAFILLIGTWVGLANKTGGVSLYQIYSHPSHAQETDLDTVRFRP